MTDLFVNKLVYYSKNETKVPAIIKGVSIREYSWGANIEITGIYQDKSGKLAFSRYKDTDFSPILLSEKLLIILGFTKDDNIFLPSCKTYKIIKENTFWKIVIFGTNGILCEAYIESLDQLQLLLNLYKIEYDFKLGLLYLL